MALDAIVPDPDAAMFTVGAVCAEAGLVATKLNVYEVPAVTVSPVWTASVKVPELNAPLDCVPPTENKVSPLFPPVTLPRVTVADATAPVSPEMVISELSDAFKSMSLATVTVMVLGLPAAGVLCPIALVVNVGTTTSRALAPPVTPYNADPGCAMALDAIVPDPDASMLTAGAVCAESGFVTTKLNVYVVPAATVCPVCTVSVRVPELNAPLDCVVPSENSNSPSSPASSSVTGLVATAPVRLDIVMTDGWADVKFVFVTIVTVNVLAAPAAGVLCPIALVVKVCPSTFTV